jgi:excisionase family DNA binding protein
MNVRPAAAVTSPYIDSRGAMVYLLLNSRSALQRLITEHRLPFVRRGGRLLFDTRDLDAWLRGTTALELARARRVAS